MRSPCSRARRRPTARWPSGPPLWPLGWPTRGVVPGDVVGLLSYNCPEFLETIFAANRLGAIAMPINWRLAPPEVQYILEHSGARVVVCDEELTRLADEAIHGHARRPGTGLHLDCRARWVDAARRPETGPRTAGGGLHRSRRRAPPDVHVGHHRADPRASCSPTPTSPGRTSPTSSSSGSRRPISGLACGPLYHVGALDLTTTSLIAAGATTIIHRAFDAAAVVDELERSRVTTVWLAPAMVNAIMALPDIEQRDLSSVRVVINGGEKMPIPLIERIQRVVPLGLVRRRVRPHRDRLGRHLPRPRQHGHQARQRRSAVPAPRARHLGRRGPIGARGRTRRDRAARPEGVQGVLARPRRDRRRVRRRLVPHRRRRGPRRGRLPLHRRSAEGHDRLGRREHRQLRGRARPLRARRRCSRSPWWAAPTTGGARSRWRSSCSDRVRPPPPTSCSSTAGGQLARFKTPKAVTFIDALPRNPSGKVLKRELRVPLTACSMNDDGGLVAGGDAERLLDGQHVGQAGHQQQCGLGGIVSGVMPTASSAAVSAPSCRVRQRSA